MLRLSIAALSLGFVLVANASLAHEDPEISAFVAEPEIGDVRLDPSGELLFISRRDASGRYIGEIRSTAAIAEGGQAFETAPAEIVRGTWLSSDRLLVTLRERTRTGRRTGVVYFQAVFDVSGTLVYRLPSNDAQVLTAPPQDPGTVFVSYDGDGDGAPDLHRMRITDGKTVRLARGSNLRFGLTPDRAGVARLSSVFDVSTNAIHFQARSAEGSWETYRTVSLQQREYFEPLGFLTDDPDEVVVRAHHESDKIGLHVYDLREGRITRTLYQRDDVDVGLDAGAQPVVQRRDGRISGYLYATDKIGVHWVDEADRALALQLDAALPGRFIIFSEPASNGYRLIRTTGAQDPSSYFLRRADGSFMALGSSVPDLKADRLSPVSFVSYPARDGRVIPAYVTTPAGRAPYPLIVLPHGGPWSRDVGGFDPWAQSLAQRGFLVVQPQFRGSTGFGLEHWQAGDREWGGAMQNDLDDAVAHLVSTGAADPRRVAMVGWSYGGYATLTAAWRGQNLYRCVIAGAAVADLDRINAGLSGDFVLRRIQKPTIEGPSPIDELNRADIPVLILHGDDDHIVPVWHGREAARVLREAGRDYRYVEIEGLGHQLDSFTEEHRRTVDKEIGRFLSGPCGLGRGEPDQPTDTAPD